MSFTQVAVSGKILLANATPASGAVVSMTLNTGITDGIQFVGPEAVTAKTASDGTFSLTVNANDDSTTLPTGTYYQVTITYGTQTLDSFNVVVPHANSSVNLFTLAVLSNPSIAIPYVSSFNGRNGIITPQTGDYNAAQIAPAVSVVAASGTPTLDVGNFTFFVISGLNVPITGIALSGTPVEAQPLWLKITDNGAPRALTLGSSFSATGAVALPTTTVASTSLYLGCVWDSITSTFKAVAAGSGGGGGGGFTPTETVYNTASGSPFSYTIPSGASRLSVRMAGAGGGGGSGRSSASGTAAAGGGGGGGGGYTEINLLVSDLTSPVTVTVGAGGPGGASQGTASTNGNNGTAGGATSFGTYARAPGGNAGVGGTTSTGSAGTGSTAQIPGGGGGAGNTAAGSSSNSAAAGAGGGGGGGFPTTAAANNGAAAAACTWNTQSTGGSAGTGSGGAGGNAGTATLPGVPGAGGGGGASSATGAGGAGGTGSAGGGGGGGGAALDGNGGTGAGGKGGDGFVVIIAS